MGANTPNYQGIFLRGYGAQPNIQNNGFLVGVTQTFHQSGALGQLQGDAIRNITATWTTGWADGYIPTVNISGAAGTQGFLATQMLANPQAIQALQPYTVVFDSSRVVPIDIENRPINVAVRYLVRAAK